MSPNKTTPAPRPTAAPQAQAGGSGTRSNSKKEKPFIEQSANSKVSFSACMSETEPNPIEGEPFALLDQPEPEPKPDKDAGYIDFWSDEEPEEDEEEEPYITPNLFL